MEDKESLKYTGWFILIYNKTYARTEVWWSESTPSGQLEENNEGLDDSNLASVD